MNTVHIAPPYEKYTNVVRREGFCKGRIGSVVCMLPRPLNAKVFKVCYLQSYVAVRISSRPKQISLFQIIFILNSYHNSI